MSTNTLEKVASTNAIVQMQVQPRFDSLMKRTYKKVYNMAYRLVGNRPDAEDLTQDAYLRAYRAFDSYEGDKPFENWIFRILTRLFLDLLRYRRRRVNSVSYDAPLQKEGSEDDLFFEKADEDSNPERALMERTVGDGLEAVLKSLPAEQRLVVVLADIENLPYRDIAEILDAPVGTIRSRLHRTHKLLRKRLAAWERANPEHMGNLGLCGAA